MGPDWESKEVISGEAVVTYLARAKQARAQWVYSPVLASLTQLPPELVVVIMDYAELEEKKSKESKEFTELLCELLVLLNTPPANILICGGKNYKGAGYTQNFVLVPLSEFVECDRKPSERELCEAVHGHLKSRLPWRRIRVHQDLTLATNVRVEALAVRLTKVAKTQLGPKAHIESIRNNKTTDYDKNTWWSGIILALLCPLAYIYWTISELCSCHVLTRTRQLRQTWAFSHVDDEQAQEELLRDIVSTLPVQTYRYDPPPPQDPQHIGGA